jgi:predicted membrane chloride channel (bestrophin family)
MDLFILGVFTVEYVLRIWAAPRRVQFFFRFFNLIDFFAIAPMYLGILNISGIRSLRLLRLIRFSRIFRIFRIFRFQKMFGLLFKLKDTVLEKILPIITIFTVLKIIIYFLEINGYWFEPYNLETMFAVIGFALGIILSQKIGVAYTKFILLEDSIIKIHGILLSLNSILKEYHKKDVASKVLQEWTDIFHEIVLRSKSKQEFSQINDKLYKEIHKLIEKEANYGNLLLLYSDLNKEASFIMNRMDALTPRAYDQILHRSTIIYSLLMIVFLPGISGIVATIIATYVLYGMYYVTDEMDDAMTHLEGKLINADIEDLVVLKERLRSTS